MRAKSDYVLAPIEDKDVTKKWLVTCFGMLSYRILSEHDTKREALEELHRITAQRHRMVAAAKGYTRDPLPQDFDVRTLDDLNALTRAILDTYNHEDDLRRRRH
jgi:transcriptional regulator of met regulon